MKKMNLKRLTALFSLIIIVVSCSKDDSLYGPKIGLKFNTVTSPFVLKSTSQSKSLSFASGTIILRRVEFQAQTQNDSVGIDFQVEMNTKIDFATGKTTPDISYAEIPAGTYDQVEVEIELQDNGPEPAIRLNGTYIDLSGTSHDVLFEFNSGENFEVEKQGKITFSTNESALAQVTIDPSAWFAAVTNEQLSSASKVNGVIVISENYNSDIFDIVSDGLDLAKEVEINQ